MIEIDGSMGEGGGQVLRTALTLALCQGESLHLSRIRANRPKPGLRRQHMAAIQAAMAISQGEAEGVVLGSGEIRFTPGRVCPGEYRFSIDSAGSTTLVLQTVLPALLQAQASSSLVLEGGTHNPLAPPFDFLQRAFFPLVERMGPRIHSRLERPGFYPAGGGRFRVQIQPCARLQPLHLPHRGAVRAHRATALIAGLPGHIAQRELAVVAERLGWSRADLVPRHLEATSGPGNVLLLEVEAEQLTEVFTAFGIKGVAAELVAERAVREVQAYLAAPVAVGEHLADQLPLIMALAGSGSFTTLTPSSHCRTNLAVIRRFLDLPIRLEPMDQEVWRIAIG